MMMSKGPEKEVPQTIDGNIMSEGFWHADIK